MHIVYQGLWVSLHHLVGSRFPLLCYFSFYEWGQFMKLTNAFFKQSTWFKIKILHVEQTKFWVRIWLEITRDHFNRLFQSDSKVVLHCLKTLHLQLISFHQPKNAFMLPPLHFQKSLNYKTWENFKAILNLTILILMALLKII